MTKNKIVYTLLFGSVIIFSIPIFFYKLGASSLTSFDEAWYAAIAKNITSTGDFLHLTFNSQPFVDHPPAGFWLIAISQTIFGVNEFGSRAASVISGLVCLALVFILGAKISRPAAGLASSIALLSSPWFISRARSGNLDIFLTMFFLLTFYLAILASENKKFLISLSLSLSLLFLTKTLVPFTIIPALVVIFWKSPVLKTRQFFFSLSLSLSLLSLWFAAQLKYYPNFIGKYLGIGLPKTEKPTSIWQNILLAKTYLHEGIGAFFRPIVISSPLVVLFINHKSLFSIIIFIFTFLIPFTFSSRGQIWHLIPVFPFLILIFFYIASSIFKSLFINHKSLASALIITFSLTLSLPQIARNWSSFIDIPAYVSDEAILSRKASTYPEPLYIDDRFLPAAVFYSGKTVNDQPTPDFSQYFNKSNPILLITHRWRLDSLNPPASRYQILTSDRDKILILIK